MRQQYLLATTIVVAAAIVNTNASADVLFSQTFDLASSNATDSDADSPTDGTRRADDFVLSEAGVVTRVTWVGLYHPSGIQPFPLPFELTIYDSVGGLPGSALSTTSVTFNNIGEISLISNPLYEYSADITPILLPESEEFFFSVYADTRGQNDENLWGWVFDGVGDSATQADANIGGAWSSYIGDRFYFVLEGNPIPEPGSLVILLGGAAALMRRRSMRRG